jgi:uncharacterized SAM-binding protein YcdF (DUF218 family)
MAFVLSKLFWLVAEPSNLFVILLCLAAALLFTRWRRWGRWLTALLAAAGLLVAVVPVSEWLLLPLENRFGPPDPMPDRVDGVIVLGGSISTYLTELRGQPVINEHGERFLAMAALARRYPQAKLVFSGGSASLLDPAFREADAARMALHEMGVDVGRVIFERRSRNTYENVIDSKALVQPQPGETWLVVTSAWHMPRAIGIFRRAGWPILPYPVDYLTSGRFRLLKGFDFTEGLGLLHRGTKEWIGLLAYYWLGYTDSLFPGPAPSGS